MSNTINVKPGHKIEIFDTASVRTFIVEPDPVYETEPYFEEGRTGYVLKLQDERTHKPYALKIFNPKFQSEKQVDYANNLKKISLTELSGLSVAKRVVISPDNNAQLIQQYTSLKYSLLMPWVLGYTWQEVLIGNKNDEPTLSLSQDECFILAARFCHLLLTIEKKKCAHCDLCSNNIITDLQTRNIELIDIEDMYGPGFTRNSRFKGGQNGYTHQRNQLGHQWCAESDRFGGAILLAEIMSWYSPAVRNLSGEESYFPSNDELHNSQTERFSVLRQALEQQTSPRIMQLFHTAWESSNLAACPLFEDWFAEISVIATQRKINLELPSSSDPLPPVIIARRERPSDRIIIRRRQLGTYSPVHNEQEPTSPMLSRPPLPPPEPDPQFKLSGDSIPSEYVLINNKGRWRRIWFTVLILSAVAALYLMWTYFEPRSASGGPTLSPFVTPTISHEPPAETPTKANNALATVQNCPQAMKPIKESAGKLCMDQYEVSNRQYAACVKDNRCTPVGSLDPLDRNVPWADDYFASDEFFDYPVVNVTWEQAQTFCTEFRVKNLDHVARLPTSEEWLTAYGTVADQSTTLEQDMPVAMDDVEQLSQSTDEIVGLTGNVREWVVLGDAEMTSPALLGRSFNHADTSITKFSASEFDRTQERRDDWGFRCVATQQ